MAKSLAKFRARLSQLGVAFSMTRQADPKLLPLIIAIPVVTAVVVWLLIGLLLRMPIFGAIMAVAFAVLAAMFVFGRRATAVQFQTIEGQPGAAAAVLQSMRGAWLVTPAVAFTRKQDFVHRVVGRPGVIMVGEGSPARVASLLKQEGRRVGRAVGDVPVHEISVGERDGQVPLDKLRNHLAKMPRAIKAKEVGPLNTRLSALGDTQLPLPKGPMPRVSRKHR